MEEYLIKTGSISQKCVKKTYHGREWDENFLFHLQYLLKSFYLSCIYGGKRRFILRPHGPPYWPSKNTETGSRQWKRTNWSAEVLPSNNASMTTIFIETKQIFHITVLIAFSITSRTRMEEQAVAKWNQPGWRIEQRYNTDVLIGNWNEERRVVSQSFVIITFRTFHGYLITSFLHNENQQAVHN